MRKIQEKQRLMKRDKGESLIEMALMIPHSMSQLQTKNKKHTKTKEEY